MIFRSFLLIAFPCKAWMSATRAAWTALAMSLSLSFDRLWPKIIGKAKSSREVFAGFREVFAWFS